MDADSSPQGPFGVRMFRQLWFGNLLSNMGGLMQSAATAWLMTSFTHSSRMVALVQVAATLPIMLLSPWGGVIADGFDRRKVMIATQSAMLLVSAGLAIAAAAGLLSPWLLLIFTFLVASGAAINATAWQASVGDIVPRRLLSAAVAYNSMGFNLARCFGPALGGSVLVAMGAVGAFALNAASYCAPIFTLWRWNSPQVSTGQSREPSATAIRTGLNYLSATPLIRRVLARAFLFGVAASAVPALLPLVVQARFSGGGTTYGILLSCFGLGAVIGAAILVRVRERWNADVRLTVAALQAAAGAAAAAASTSVPLCGGALLLAGSGWLQTLSTLNALVQLGSAPWVTGRIVSLYRVAAFAGITAGSWLAGEFAHFEGLAAALAAAAILQSLVACRGYWQPLRELEGAKHDPLDRWRIPSTALPTSSLPGPIFISIEYEIDKADTPAFIEAMVERRRIRIRDGARRWMLVRDLGRAEIWRERYEVYDWDEYVRHNGRRTISDAANTERIHSLHRGSHPLEVRREHLVSDDAMHVSRSESDPSHPPELQY